MTTLTLIHINNSQTRLDCERDGRAVRLPNASILGFGVNQALPGYWIHYTTSDMHERVGRVICRVTCELKIWIEAAVLSDDCSHVYLRWVDPEWVIGCRAVPPRRPLHWITSIDEWNPHQVHADLAFGVSDLPNQIKNNPPYNPGKKR